MSVLYTDIKFYITPTGNTNPNLSLGGSGQGSEVDSGGIGTLFDNISPAQASAGVIDYRAIDVKNTNVSETLTNAVVWVSVETTSSDTTIEIAYDTGTQSVATDETAPSSPALTFSKPASAGAGISLGSIAAGATKRIWLRRTVTAGSAQSSNDAGEITVTGGTT